MSVPIRSQLAADCRAEIASVLVQTLPREQRTLLLELLGRSFVDLYFEVEKTRRPNRLTDWVDRMCDAHADSPAVRAFFSAACGALGRFLTRAGAGQTSRTLLHSLDESIRAIAAKPRRSLQQSTSHLDEIDAAIQALLVRLERSDPLTAEHSRAVSAWCSRLARRLSLSEHETVFVARCGMIHDIGKITTPSDILTAPRSLTPEEWTRMREHTTAGERIVSNDDLVRPFAPAVRSHHERLDGRGYPDSLDGSALPLTTRIVTVADSFNAMIGRRPYRLPMSPASAIDQLAHHSGTQFDPTVVAAMRDIVR
jgi:putative nucleotidyltransferase with HDIG domain